MGIKDGEVSVLGDGGARGRWEIRGGWMCRACLGELLRVGIQSHETSFAA